MVMADARKPLKRQEAKRIWIHAQRLDTASPFGPAQAGVVTRAVEHLGYVQIDTINVIERCHHHILFNRIPGYRREHLGDAQTKEKSVFEYWTHALSYVPSRDFRFFLPQMNAYRRDPSRWFYKAPPSEVRRVLKTVEKDGAITIRDINDEVLVEKNHAWASRKPSKKALEVAFYGGQVVISERIGMLKRYELTARHFGWDENPEAKPKPATEAERFEYRLDRALRSQGLISLDSVSYLEPSAKPKFLKLIERRVRKGELSEVAIEGVPGKFRYWSSSEIATGAEPTLTHILSPFDPLVIQRKRLSQFFGYEHRFEAYLPKEKRIYGYFALPVLMDDEIVALLDLKTDRQKEKLLVQKWTWLKKFKSKERKRRIEEALGRFEAFQLQREPERG
jgi:uncharacterized protein YcaQ